MDSDKSIKSQNERDIGTYDIIQAENRAKQEQNITNNNTTTTTTVTTNGTSTSSTLRRESSSTMNSSDSELKKKRLPTEVSYHLAKEFLMTERTYKKDLDILNGWFQGELTADDIETLQPLYILFESFVQHHSVFLRDLEHRIILWETHVDQNLNESHKIGDVLLKNMVILPIYEEYIENLCEILQRLNEMFYKDERFQEVYRNFEQQKICYVPIMYLLLKPLHRLLHYQSLLERKLEFLIAFSFMGLN